jgi:DNA-binding transcriptional MerR regulator
MAHRTYSIGEAARLSGVSVRRLRFYSDQGLLPPAGRTESGYRVFTDSELVRLDLISCLRDAGLGLDAIREVLSKQLSLTEALTLRLRALETEIAAQRRIAAALRAALRSPELTEAHLRRIWTMTKLSRDERRSVIEAYYERISDGVNIDPEWMRQMIEASVPELPEKPTPEQCDAWTELSGILRDPVFAANMRKNAKDIWDDATFDAKVWKTESDAILIKANDAIVQGFEPTSEAGQAIAREWVEITARLTQRKPDADFRVWLRAKYGHHDARAVRYWELVAILRGQSPCGSPNKEWEWMAAAMKHHLADAPLSA